MSESTKRYFVCTYGNFERDFDVLKEAISENAYRLHEEARYPAALEEIKKGNTIFLQNYCWIVAWGIATDSVQEDEQNKSCHVLHVDKWRSLNPDRVEDGVRSYGIRWATEIGGSMSVVKKVSEEWAKGILARFAPPRETLPENELSCKEMPLSVAGVPFRVRLCDTFENGVTMERDEPEQVKPKIKKNATENDADLIRNFWLCSPNAMTGMFWLQYRTPNNKFIQFPVFISIRDLFRLFKLEGVDPLVVEEVDERGYYFSRAVLRNDGRYEIETADEYSMTVVGVVPADDK